MLPSRHAECCDRGLAGAGAGVCKDADGLDRARAGGGGSRRQDNDQPPGSDALIEVSALRRHGYTSAGAWQRIVDRVALRRRPAVERLDEHRLAKGTGRGADCEKRSALSA